VHHLSQDWATAADLTSTRMDEADWEKQPLQHVTQIMFVSDFPCGLCASIWLWQTVYEETKDCYKLARRTQVTIVVVENHRNSENCPTIASLTKAGKQSLRILTRDGHHINNSRVLSKILQTPFYSFLSSSHRRPCPVLFVNIQTQPSRCHGKVRNVAEFTPPRARLTCR